MYIRIESVPQFLKENGRFCNWKYEQRGGRRTKVSYIPRTTRQASVDGFSTFMSQMGPPRSHSNIRRGKIFAEMVKSNLFPWLYIEKHVTRTDITRGHRYADPR